MIDTSKIAEWIRKKVDDAKAEGIVVGLSGGVDSCVTTLLCEEALNGRNILTVMMPIEPTKTLKDSDDCMFHTEDQKHALEFLKEFHMDSITVDLYESFMTTSRIISLRSTSWGLNDLTKANMKARLRMTTLYSIANQRNYLVAGTCNKSELRLGYFTKHGDGAADFEPLADYYKTEVYQIAKDLGIPQSIIDRPPSAGLWAGQTDESELGFSYELADKIFMMEDKSQHKVNQPDYYKRNV